MGIADKLQHEEQAAKRNAVIRAAVWGGIGLIFFLIIVFVYLLVTGGLPMGGPSQP